MADYRYYPPAYPPAPTQSSSMATISLIMGIASWVILPVIGAIVAVITGHMARREINASMGRITGGGQATAGLVLGYLQLGLAAVSLCLGICYFAFVMIAASSSGGFN
ncbi:MAG TPA: DUF4190 domain-containing protein [Anaerolineae bacterium]|nr:DUF4190 domain-containing protein [Anaerolineae bacterium]HPL26786.1 DUF4190 domain-containing protein [Anaerolineae bacterium]